MVRETCVELLRETLLLLAREGALRVRIFSVGIFQVGEDVLHLVVAERGDNWVEGLGLLPGSDFRLVGGRGNVQTLLDLADVVPRALHLELLRVFVADHLDRFDPLAEYLRLRNRRFVVAEYLLDDVQHLLALDSQYLLDVLELWRLLGLCLLRHPTVLAQVVVLLPELAEQVGVYVPEAFQGGLLDDRAKDLEDVGEIVVLGL